MSPSSTETQVFVQLEPEKQQRILDAAIAEFSDKGYTNASMNIVVKAAGISKGALFKYFTSKSGLFVSVYKIALRLVKDYLRRVREESREEDFFLRLEKILLAGVKFIADYPGLARIYYHILYTGDAPHKNEILEELHAESVRFLRKLIEQGIEKGQLRADLNPDVCAFVLQCVLDRFIMAHRLEFMGKPLLLDDPDASRARIAEIIEMFKNGIGNRNQQDI